MSKEQQIKELMVAIRKMVKPSACIDNFEQLLNEMSNELITGVIISDMNKFIESFVILERSLDKIDDNSLKSKILTYDFLCPKSQFKTSFRDISKHIIILRVLNEKFGEHRTYDFGKYNMLGKLPVNILEDYDKEYKVMDYVHYLGMEKEVAYENLRKTFLLWNYTPAIVKAIIMTKRRALGFDSNSKKF